MGWASVQGLRTGCSVWQVCSCSCGCQVFFLLIWSEVGSSWGCSFCSDFSLIAWWGVCYAACAGQTQFFSSSGGGRAWTLNSVVSNNLTSCLVMLHWIHALHFITVFATNLSVREGRGLKTFRLYYCLCILSSCCNDFSCGTTAFKILCVKARETGMKTVLQGKQFSKWACCSSRHLLGHERRMWRRVGLSVWSSAVEKPWCLLRFLPVTSSPLGFCWQDRPS